MKYILKGHEPVKEPDLTKWGKWFEKSNRFVNKSTANVYFKGENVGQVTVSTVFIGLDHAFFGGPPLLFETMVLAEG